MLWTKSRRVFFIFYITALIATVMIGITQSSLQNSALDALRVCALSVVPALFPFMVISSLLTSYAPILFYDTSKRIPIINLPICSVIPMTLGAVCGFPTGIITVAGLKKRGLLSKKQAELTAMLSANTGPAFLIQVVGNSFWSSREIGIKLYLLQLLCTALLGSVWILTENRFTDTSSQASITTPYPYIPFPKAFTDAVSSSSAGIIKICGYIVFFSVFSEVLSGILPSDVPITHALISSVLEFTSGCRSSVDLGRKIGIPISAFAVGFSGISVLTQSSDFSFSAGFSLKKTVIFKVIQGILCGTIANFLI